MASEVGTRVNRLEDREIDGATVLAVEDRGGTRLVHIACRSAA